MKKINNTKPTNVKKRINLSLMVQMVIMIFVFVSITAVFVNINSIHKHRLESIQMTHGYLEDLATESGGNISRMLNMMNNNSSSESGQNNQGGDRVEGGRPEGEGGHGMSIDQMMQELSFGGYQIEAMLVASDGSITYDSDETKAGTTIAYSEIKDLLKQASAGTLAAKASGTVEVTVNRKVYDFAYYVEDDASVFGILLAQDEYLNEIRAFVRSNTIIGALIALGCALIGGVIVYFMTKPLTDVEHALKKMGDFDFTKNPKEDELCKHMGETGSIAQASKKLRTAFVEIASQLNHNADTMKEIVSDNAETCSTVSAGTQENLALIEDISSNTDEASKNLESCAELTRAIQTGMSDLRAGTEDIAQSSEKSTHDAGATLAEATKSSEAVVENANNMETLTNESIDELLKINEIGNLTQTIKGIANQTNLLSLNASIEAARAGEAGRGFAVVADQIGKLSQDTGRAVTEIETVVQDLEGTVEHVSDVLRQLITALKESSEGDMAVIQNLGNAFVDNCQSNLAAVEEISASSDSLEENCNSSANATDKVKDEVQIIANNLKSVANNTQANADAIGKVAEGSQKIDKMAEELVNIVKKFKI
ncbi:MAG: methyl-accepting chemotaxis protein [Lachnospiraceae bacterium]|nr:methyl-accepting chemotaxis protein [Lachnospiraceae bacterium]